MKCGDVPAVVSWPVAPCLPLLWSLFFLGVASLRTNFASMVKRVTCVSDVWKTGGRWAFFCGLCRMQAAIVPAAAPAGSVAHCPSPVWGQQTIVFNWSSLQFPDFWVEWHWFLNLCSSSTTRNPAMTYFTELIPVLFEIWLSLPSVSRSLLWGLGKAPIWRILLPFPLALLLTLNLFSKVKWPHLSKMKGRMKCSLPWMHTSSDRETSFQGDSCSIWIALVVKTFPLEDRWKYLMDFYHFYSHTLADITNWSWYFIMGPLEGHYQTLEMAFKKSPLWHSHSMLTLGH